MIDFNAIDGRSTLAGTNHLELLMFRLNDTSDSDRNSLYGINVFKVRELMVLPTLTLLPDAHPCLRGVASIRGKVVPVIDMNRYCGFDDHEDSAILIVTEFNGSTQGLLVTEVDDIVRANWSDIDEPPEMVTETSDDMLTAVSRLDDTRMLLIIDVERVIAEVLGASDPGAGSIASIENTQRQTVFFADDSAVARVQIGKILDRMNLPHQSANNGQEALDALRVLADEADSNGIPLKHSLLAVITDVEMPRMDGYVLTSKLKSDPRFEGVPIMMHSSLSASENRKLGVKVGADGYMPKLQPEAFSAMLTDLIRNAHPNLMSRGAGSTPSG